MMKVFLIFLKFIQKNSQLYYGEFWGSDQPIVLFLKNLIKPKRYFYKLLYGQKTWFPALKGKPLSASAISPIARQCAEEIKRNGYTVFPQKFPEIADKILLQNEKFINSIAPDKQYHDFFLREMDQEVLAFLTHDFFIQTIGSYLKRQPYLRMGASLKVTYPNARHLTSREMTTQHRFVADEKFNVGWHYDTVNMVQIHFLLDDATSDGTHMVYAKNSHRIDRECFRVEDFNYSDETVSDRYEIVPFIGKKGSVYIWDSNGLHKAHLVPNSRRLMIQLLFTPGNSIVTQMNPDPLLKINANGLNLNALSSYSQESLHFVLDR